MGDEMLNIDEYEYKLFKFVTENLPDVIYVYDIIEKKNVYSNEGISMVLGYTATELREMGEQLIPVLMHPDDLENYLNTILQRYQNAADNEWIEHDYRMRHKDGDWRWLSSKETIYKRTSSGAPKQILGFLNDVTEKKQVESVLQDALRKAEENERTFRKLFEDSSDAILLIDTSGVFVECNQAALDLLKMTREQFIFKSPAGISPEFQPNGRKSVDAAVDLIALAHKNGLHRFDWTHVNAEGGEFIVEVSLMPVSIKGQTMLHTTWRDITNRKRIETELVTAKEKIEESEQKYRSMFASMQEGVYLHEMIYDAQGKAINYRIIDANPISEKYLNIKREDAIGKIATDLYGTNEAPLLEIYAKVAETGEPVSFEQYFPPMDKHFFISAFSPRKGGFATAFFDITESKNHRIELIKAKEKAEESNRLKTEFLNNMSHEIRTPMNGIMGFSELLSQPDLTAEKRIYYTRIVQNSALQLLHVIDDILEISTLSTKQVKVNVETFCLNDFLMELFSIFNLKAQERKIPIYLKKGLPDDQSNIKTDKAKLSKVLMNLIENAVKYTATGFIEIGYTYENQNFRLYVRDTGIGIDPGYQKVVFERFSQEEQEVSKKLGGLGLGLAIAKENAELIGGAITLESVKGKGSTFYLTIPDDDGERLNRPGAGIAEKAKQKPEFTILVAEDEEINYLYIETVLEKIPDYTVESIHARNGQEAVDLFKENNSIDLVLMDLKMPVMNGLEATSIMKKMKSSVPIVAQTAYSTEAEMQKAIESGCSDFIIKPIDRQKLVELVNKFVAQK